MPGHYTARNLRRRYQSSSGDAVTAIDIESLSVKLGGTIAIVGGSGSGKTTLLNLLGLLEPCDSVLDLETSLQIQLPGDEVAREVAAGANAQGSFPYEKVSYIFQQGYLLNQASLAVNLGLTRRAAGWKADDKALKQLLELAQLNEDGEQQVNKKLSDRAVSLSGGQQQRINIARALGREPSIIFADELTSSLDPMKAHDVMTVLRDWVWDGGSFTEHDRTSLHRTVFWVTHDYALACEFADAIIVLSNGRLAGGCNQPIELDALENRPASLELMEWVKAGAVSAGKQNINSDVNPSPEHSGISAEQPTTGGSQKLSYAGAVLGNMKDGVLLSLMEAYPPAEYTGRTEATGGFKSVLARPFTGFSHWARALQLAAVLALIMIVTYGQKEVISYFDAQLNDPALRHVIVQQNTLALERSVINAQSLGDLSASIAALDPRGALAENGDSTRTLAEQVAFGRFTESADVYPQNVDRINPGFIPEATIGVFDADEPVYQSLDIAELDSAGGACSFEGGATPRDLIPYGDELAVIVTRDFINRFSAMYDADLCATPFVDIWDAGEPKTFRVAGIANKAPADGFETFDIMLQAEVWRTWVSLANRPVIDTFSRAAVYFNQLNHSGVIQELKERSFAFDQEIIDKFERLIGTAAKLRNTFLVITWLTLAVAATVAAGLIWGYLAQNAQSIALLRAHAAWSWPLLAAIPFQLLLTFVYGLFYLAIAVMVWNALVMFPAVSHGLLYASGGSWVVGAITWSMLEPTLPWVIGSLFVMLLVGWLCLLLWRLTHRQLAHELRQAY